VASFVTRARVTGSGLRVVQSWWDENWPALTAVAGGLGAAVLARSS
jgi:hypothetical protein